MTATRSSGRALLASMALLLSGACDTGKQSEESGGAADVQADQNWQAVQAYLDSDAAWHADESQDKGPHPEIEQAVAAARTIVADASHPQLADAAVFLVEHPAGLSKTAEEDIDLGLRRLMAHVGANWQVVEDYRQRKQNWQERLVDVALEGDRAIDVVGASEEDVSDDKKARLAERMAERMAEQPNPLRALAAAAAIADVEGHEKRQEAAEFLLGERQRRVADQLVVKGVQTLLDHFPDYDGWQKLFDGAGEHGFVAHLDSGMFETIESRATDPVLKATARYYLAANLISAANAWTTSAEARDDLRERARNAVTGLSDGVGDKEFQQQRFSEDGALLSGTFSDAEADLLFRLNHATAGGVLPEATGQRLDGMQENLSAYAGKVVLVDFWATWCVPCIRALPKLRELHQELPADRFTLLSVSVDDELDTVTDFMANEPMPWSNWQVGSSSDIGNAWNIKAFPTYILVDQEGVILARTNRFDDRLVALAKEAVGAAT